MLPKFVALSEANPGAVFLKVVGDSSPDASKLMKREGVRSVPSFHYWKDGAKVRARARVSMEGTLLRTRLWGLATHAPRVCVWRNSRAARFVCVARVFR